MIKQRKLKKCKVCGTEFTPIRPMQNVCGGKCALVLVKAVKEKKAKEEQSRKLKARKKALKPLRHWINYTQRVVNDYVRELEKDEPCISCGTHNAYEWDAGHYRTTAAASQLRFNLDNVHKQCRSCNTHKSGNVTQYRINLVKKIGEKRVQALESNNETHTYTVEELEHIRQHFRKLHRELLKNNQCQAAL